MLQQYKHIFSRPLSFWVANASSENVPDTLRCIGVLPFGDDNSITLFIPVVFATQFMQNVKTNINITLSITVVRTYESFQFKGQVANIRLSTAEEEILQEAYVNQLADAVAEVGHPRQLSFDAIFHPPCYAVTFKVTHIFEQTPRKGTGRLLNSLKP